MLIKKQFPIPVLILEIRDPCLSLQVILINQDWELNPQVLGGQLLLEITNF